MDELILKILELIRSNLKSKELREELENYHDNDIATALPHLTSDERKKLYKIIGIERTSDIFTFLDDVEEYLTELDEEKAADIIEEMDIDDALDVLEELDEEDKENIIKNIEEDIAEEIEMISSYEDDEVGSKMTTSFITIPLKSTIKNAMRILVKEAGEHQNISFLFVVDDIEKFYGVIELTDLITAREGDSLESIIRTEYPTLNDHQKISDVIPDLKEYDLSMYPVLDENEFVIGVITSSDIIESIEEEMSEDYAKLAGISSDEDIDEPLRVSIKKRLPWLALLLILGLGVSLLISVFENIIAAVPMVVFFQSIILGMTGNVGTQSLAVTIRFISDEKFNRKNILRMIGKELRVGFFNGLILGAIGFLMVFLFFLIKHEPIYSDVFNITEALFVSLAVFGAMTISMIIASFLGVFIPSIFKKLKIDPAVASGAFMTTLDDMIAVICYYGLVMLFLL